MSNFCFDYCKNFEYKSCINFETSLPQTIGTVTVNSCAWFSVKNEYRHLYKSEVQRLKEEIEALKKELERLK